MNVQSSFGFVRVVPHRPAACSALSFRPDTRVRDALTGDVHPGQGGVPAARLDDRDGDVRVLR